MMFKYIYFSIFLFILHMHDSFCLEPITVTTIVAVAAASYYSEIYCSLSDCCFMKMTPAVIEELKSDLESNLFGQHIAEDVVVKSLKGHISNEHPRKALALSFHGWPGNGKNYLSEKIAKYLYKDGSNSKYVKIFHGSNKFNEKDKVKEYQEALKTIITNTVKSCSRSLFIFDEVDKMPETLLDVLKPYIDYNSHVDNVDFRKSIFIFLSNAGSADINKVVSEAYIHGLKRTELIIKNFEPLILRGAFNTQGGFRRSNNIESMLIDHYIPFLPMEDIHVKQCIVQEYKNNHISNIKDHYIDEVFDEIDFGEGKLNKFSISGCKRISQRVSYIITKYNLKRNESPTRTDIISAFIEKLKNLKINIYS